LTDELTAGYAYSFLDFEFKDFRNGNCYNYQVPDGDVVNGIPLCNFKGKTGQYTPENNLSLYLDYAHRLGNDLEIFGNLNLNYIDSQNIHDNLDPQYEIDSQTKVNIRLGVRNENWSLAFIGKNITDEEVLSYAGNVPISASVFGTNTFYAFVGRPRQYALELGFRY
jgi:iron complex outermembrane receptor protein